MKILFIVPGSGDSFYCGNCFRDNLQVAALRKAGYEVIVMPLYLPLRHASFRADTPLFFPATTFYTAQKLFGKRKMPHWLSRFTGSEAMLHIASSLSGSTSGSGMEQMTLSMITAEDPTFLEMMNPLIDWMKEREKPDVIHLSSTLLLGVAKVIRQHMSIPIVCSVQDEEVWIDTLEGKQALLAWQGIAENSCYIDRFITTSHFYKEVLKARVAGIQTVEVIYPGVDRTRYASSVYPEQPVIGFFYRMNRKNGLDTLAKAFVLLKQRDTVKNLRLRIGGGYTSRDKKFLKEVKKILSPYAADVVMDTTYSPGEHASFYKEITVLSVPLTFAEGVGLYLCEAFAAGCPAVEPAIGSFREIVGNAGILYEPHSSVSLADALETILADSRLLAQYRENALHLSATRYSDRVLADKLSDIYKQLLLNRKTV